MEIQSLTRAEESLRPHGATPPSAMPEPRDRVELGARASSPQGVTALRSHRTCDADPLETRWGYGPNENRFNGLILRAVADRWGTQEPRLPPLLMKSLVAQESAFDPNAVSPTGYVGLAQLGVQEAIDEGLQVWPVDERFIPEKNVRAGVGVLASKKDAITHPESLDRDFAQKVAEAYERYGHPEGEGLWTLILASYNGGQGTILRAMARAYDQGRDPRSWDSLVEPRAHPRQSPLYGATLEVFGPERALSKYHEIRRYPTSILERAPIPT